MGPIWGLCFKNLGAALIQNGLHRVEVNGSYFIKYMGNLNAWALGMRTTADFCRMNLRRERAPPLKLELKVALGDERGAEDALAGISSEGYCNKWTVESITDEASNEELKDELPLDEEEEEEEEEKVLVRELGE